jgi:hypothetical protein
MPLMMNGWAAFHGSDVVFLEESPIVASYGKMQRHFSPRLIRPITV